ncbi:MAG: methyl-accepting chemotaxis protein [Chitinispirillaceae bacterium]
MFKNMSLGAKIGTGFGALILIAIILGSLAVWNMTRVSSQTDRLANEHMPEVDLSGQMERNSQSTMYAIRGYAFSEEEQYYEEAQMSMERVKEALEDAKVLADKSRNLVKLKGSVDEIEESVTLYENHAKKTYDLNKRMGEERIVLQTAADEYMKACEEFLESQNEQMQREMSSGASAVKMRERLEKITLVNDIIDYGNITRVENWRAQATRQPKLIRTAIANFDSINDKFSALRKITYNSEDKRQIDITQESANEYRAAMQNVLTLWEQRDKVQNLRETEAGTILSNVKMIAESGMAQTAEISQQTMSLLGIASTIMIVGLVFALLIGVSLAVFITRGITKPIRGIIDGLTQGSEQVASASNQVSSSSQSMAEGASEQASSLEEISSSLEEMSSMTKQNAGNSRQAEGLTNESGELVKQGLNAMERLTKAIGDINSSANETAKIIKNIDEIAFQTNLLALNAAVEAARAGEAGKGFAVVAEEVRNLAQRAAEAAKDTAALIEGSKKNAENGVGLADETSKSIQSIAESSSKVAGLIQEVAAASNEQAQGIEQVNTAVAQLDQVTQGNAANAEESASASEELSAQAGNMNDIVKNLVRLVEGGNHSGQLSISVASPKSNGLRRPVLENKSSVATMPRKPAISNNRSEAKNKNGQKKVVNPSDVIPFDDDEELSEF